MVFGASVASRSCMSIIAFIILGVIAGFLARALMPGRQSMGFFATALLGMAGSFLGGFIGNLISGERLLNLHASGLIGSVIGAMIVLLLVVTAGRRRSRA
ncbi:MAG TPA: GlsB/YeaQ/YmgE family stress response membrane protein [Polyangiales bacterium]|nr:GlsB/YeaQ/YmgE family stress response membrane protein [Polyangiales bacterium]